MMNIKRENEERMMDSVDMELKEGIEVRKGVDVFLEKGNN